MKISTANVGLDHVFGAGTGDEPLEALHALGNCFLVQLPITSENGGALHGRLAGLDEVMQSPGKLAGFLDGGGDDESSHRDQACFTWSAHSVASFAFSEAQAWTKGSKLFEQ